MDCANTGGPPPPAPIPCPNVQSNTITYTNACSNSSPANNCPAKKVCDVDACRKRCDYDANNQCNHDHGNSDCDPHNQPTESCINFKENGCCPGHTYSCFVDQQNVGGQCKPKPVTPSNNCVVSQNTCGQLGDPICANSNGCLDFCYYHSERQRGTGNNTCMENYETCPQKVPVCTQKGQKTCVIQNITDCTKPPIVRTFNCNYPESNAAATPCSNTTCPVNPNSGWCNTKS